MWKIRKQKQIQMRVAYPIIHIIQFSLQTPVIFAEEKTAFRMKTTLKITLLAFIASFALVGCGGNASNTETGSGDSTNTAVGTGQGNSTSWEKGGLKVTALEDSPQFPDAKLSLVSPERGTDLAAGENAFEFKVENYQLGQQTADATTKGIANSDKGQHIHFILNNGPYTAYYEPSVKTPLEDGHYVLLAFLARSYHESLKNPGAFQLRQFVVGSPANYKEANLSAPHLFFSRPKGKYTGPKETSKLLLDFYLVNCDLSPDGYKVRATINGNEFMFTKWVPYVIEGLPLGEVKIKLELLDAEGKTVVSPFNPMERTATLEAAAS